MTYKLIPLFLLLGAIKGNSQTAPGVPEITVADTGREIKEVVAGYINQIGARGDLYYGIEHTGYSSKIEGVAYFESSDWQKGSVTYNGVLYTDISLKYDMVADELIALHPNNYFSLALSKEKISSFTIGDNHFVYIQKNNKHQLAPGFYQVMEAGKLTLLVKRAKKIEEKVNNNNELEQKFVENYNYYLVKDGLAHHITNESSAMDLLDDKVRKIRTRLKEKEIVFRKMKELALLEIATYYNQLSL